MQTLRTPTRTQIETVMIDHPVMPVELVIADDEVAIRTGKSGSQTQRIRHPRIAPWSPVRGH